MGVVSHVILVFDIKTLVFIVMQFSNINENIFDSDIETAVRNKAINLKAEKTRNEFIVIVDEQSLIFSLTDK